MYQGGGCTRLADWEKIDDDEWEYGEKRTQVMAIIQDIVLDAMIETLTKIEQRNDWMNPAKETSQESMKF